MNQCLPVPARPNGTPPGMEGHPQTMQPELRRGDARTQNSKWKWLAVHLYHSAPHCPVWNVYSSPRSRRRWRRFPLSRKYRTFTQSPAFASSLNSSERTHCAAAVIYLVVRFCNCGIPPEGPEGAKGAAQYYTGFEQPSISENSFSIC